MDNSTILDEHHLHELISDRVVIIATAFTIIVFVVGIPGNALLIGVLTREKKKSSTDVYITCLAASYIVALLFYCPVELARQRPALWNFIGSDLLCRLHFFSNQWIYLVLTALVFTIGCDRFLKIYKPHAATRMKKISKRVCIALVVASAIFSVAFLVSTHVDPAGHCTYNMEYRLTNIVWYILMNVIATALSPVLAWFYLKIALYLRKRERVGIQNRRGDNTTTGTSNITTGSKRVHPKRISVISRGMDGYAPRSSSLTGGNNTSNASIFHVQIGSNQLHPKRAITEERRAKTIPYTETSIANTQACTELILPNQIDTKGLEIEPTPSIAASIARVPSSADKANSKQINKNERVTETTPSISTSIPNVPSTSTNMNQFNPKQTNMINRGLILGIPSCSHTEGNSNDQTSDATIQIPLANEGSDRVDLTQFIPKIRQMRRETIPCIESPSSLYEQHPSQSNTTRTTATNETPTINIQVAKRGRIRTTGIMFLITLVFFLTTVLPSAGLAFSFSTRSESEDVGLALFLVARLPIVSYVANPILFVITSSKFRKNLALVFKCK